MIALVFEDVFKRKHCVNDFSGNLFFFLLLEIIFLYWKLVQRRSIAKSPEKLYPFRAVQCVFCSYDINLGSSPDLSTFAQISFCIAKLLNTTVVLCQFKAKGIHKYSSSPLNTSALLIDNPMPRPGNQEQKGDDKLTVFWLYRPLSPQQYGSQGWLHGRATNYESANFPYYSSFSFLKPTPKL